MFTLNCQMLVTEFCNKYEVQRAGKNNQAPLYVYSYYGYGKEPEKCGTLPENEARRRH